MSFLVESLLLESRQYPYRVSIKNKRERERENGGTRDGKGRAVGGKAAFEEEEFATSVKGVGEHQHPASSSDRRRESGEQSAFKPGKFVWPSHPFCSTRGARRPRTIHWPENRCVSVANLSFISRRNRARGGGETFVSGTMLGRGANDKNRRLRKTPG